MKDIIVSLLIKNTKLQKAEIEKIIEIPPNYEMGDYAFPCFTLSKTLKKNPVEIALELSRVLSKKLPKEISKVENKGPYLNFFIERKILAKEIITQALNESYGSEKQGNKIIIETEV